ncbi:MAG TPA: hypothetical protein VKE94_01860 [Gemmataceae bacterium]|nr:hypothetical protein [Gemmataceae bacterium]
MTRRLTMLLAGIACLLVLGMSGCGKARPKADPHVARDTLRAALDAWKTGQPADALQARDPPIHVTDHEWRNGFALLEYEVSEKDQLFGPALRCQVQLTLRNPKGKPVNKNATYSVGTNNALTVVREDDD